jgi:MFS transporter, NNP family, nitrate/nitrite transporter
MPTNIKDWNPEDPKFWESTGKSIAYRNLWISVPSLLNGFAIWLMWGIIAVQMLNLGFPFSKEEMFTLTAISGLAGATLRIPASFFIRIAGGRNTIFLTTALLMIPAIGTGIALQDKTTPLWVFQMLALLSGIGGGNFACSMSNISTFFPKRLQGTALGINAGLGNFGVTTMQIVIPLVMTTGVFAAVAGGSMELVKDSGWIFGKIVAGTPTYIQNAGFVWLLLLVPLAFLGFFGMNNLLTVTPSLTSTLAAFAKILWLYGLAFLTAAVGLYLYLPAPTGLGLLNMWVALPLIVIVTLLVMKLAAFGEMKANIGKQFAIFQEQAHLVDDRAVHRDLRFLHRLLDGAAAVDHRDLRFQPRARCRSTGVMSHTLKNPNAPSALTYAWIGPFVGALIRPVGGWISDKVGGSIVTQVISAVMVAPRPTPWAT